MNKAQNHIYKRALISIMLCVYVFGLLKPMMPIVKDLLAHTFFKSAHMATVHYENGRYHLHLELSEEAQQGDSKQTPLITADDTLLTHLNHEALTFTMYLQKISEINSPYKNVHTEVYLSMPLLPPEC